MAAPPNGPLFELIWDGDLDEFAKAFVRKHMVPLVCAPRELRAPRLVPAPAPLARNGERASRDANTTGAGRRDGDGDQAGDRDPGEDVRGGTVRGSVILPASVAVMRIRQSYIVNSKTATAHGKYLVRGLRPEWDMAAYGVLKAPRLQSDVVPGSALVPNVQKAWRFAATLGFRGGISRVSRLAARLIFFGQYAANTILYRGAPHSYANRVAMLIHRVEGVHREIRTVLRSTGSLDPVGQLLQALLPDAVREASGTRATGAGAYFVPAYRNSLEHALGALYGSLCECTECASSRFQLGRRLACQREGRNARRIRAAAAAAASATARPPLFEDNRIVLRAFPQFGVLRLPPVRHVPPGVRDKIYEKIASGTFVTASAASVLLPYAPPTCRKKRVFHLGGTLALALFAVQTAHTILEHEEEQALRYLRDGTEALYRLLRTKAKAGGAAHETRGETSRLYECRAEELRLGLLEADRFPELLVRLLSVCESLPEYAEIPNACREEILLHHFNIKKAYSSFPALNGGEQLSRHVMRHGDPVVQDDAFFMDEDNGFLGRLYDNFDAWNLGTRPILEVIQAEGLLWGGEPFEYHVQRGTAGPRRLYAGRRSADGEDAE